MKFLSLDGMILTYKCTWQFKKFFESLLRIIFISQNHCINKLHKNTTYNAAGCSLVIMHRFIRLCNHNYYLSNVF